MTTQHRELAAQVTAPLRGEARRTASHQLLPPARAAGARHRPLGPGGGAFGWSTAHEAAGSARSVRMTKLQETYGRLADLAHELGPEAKLPTVLQLRDRLGVSVATLNAALSELEAQHIIRRKHGVGIYVSSRVRQRRVALVCDPSFFRAPGASPFWNLLVDRVRERGAPQGDDLGGESVSLHFAVDSLERPDAAGADLLNDGLADDIAAGRLDGVLGVGLPSHLATWIERQRVLVVAFAGPGTCAVTLDDRASLRLGIGALAGQGCRRVALWWANSPYRRFEGAPRLPVSPARLRAATEALGAAGLPFDPALMKDNSHLVVPGGYHTESHQEQGFRTAMEVFGPGVDPSRRPDGVFCGDDMMTQGAITALHKLGLRVGRDVRIATHANAGSPALLGWEDELTLVEVDPAEIVSRMFDLLEQCMDGETPSARESPVAPRLRSPSTGRSPHTLSCS